MRHEIDFLVGLAFLSILAAEAAAEISVSSDRASYAVGDSVRITIHNSGPEDADFNSEPFARVFNPTTSSCFYGCLGLPVVTPFPAGTTVNLTWETAGMSAQAGSLVVAVNYIGDPVTAHFDLTGGVQAKPVPWSVVKTTYQAR